MQHARLLQVRGPGAFQSPAPASAPCPALASFTALRSRGAVVRAGGEGACAGLLHVGQARGVEDVVDSSRRSRRRRSRRPTHRVGCPSSRRGLRTGGPRSATCGLWARRGRSSTGRFRSRDLREPSALAPRARYAGMVETVALEQATLRQLHAADRLRPLRAARARQWARADDALHLLPERRRATRFDLVARARSVRRGARRPGGRPRGLEDDGRGWPHHPLRIRARRAPAHGGGFLRGTDVAARPRGERSRGLRDGSRAPRRGRSPVRPSSRASRRGPS